MPGLTEIIIIVAIALLFFGAKWLPRLGQSVRDTVRATKESLSPSASQPAEAPKKIEERAPGEVPLRELRDQEQFSLWGLALLITGLDLDQVNATRAPLREIADQLGEKRITELTKRARDWLERDDAVEAFTAIVERREVKELIFSRLFDIATIGTVVERESALLDQIKRSWRLDDVGAPYRG